MKRISFQYRGGLNLTQAVLSGLKTMTRIAVPYRVETDAMKYAEGDSNYTRVNFEYIFQHSNYKIGDVVAIKQAYAANMMPHNIRITDICVERLQDISYEDCLLEGVYRDVDGGKVIGYPFGVPFYYTFTGAVNKDGKNLHWVTPREAFTALIDKVSGRGTWERNPLVWAYTFKIID